VVVVVLRAAIRSPKWGASCNNKTVGSESSQEPHRQETYPLSDQQQPVRSALGWIEKIENEVLLGFVNLLGLEEEILSIVDHDLYNGACQVHHVFLTKVRLIIC
jgi:hypothetical protein